MSESDPHDIEARLRYEAALAMYATFTGQQGATIHNELREYAEGWATK